MVAYEWPGVIVYQGDCLDVLAELPDASVSAVVTDPPYELAFMGRAWDASGVAFSPAVWRECLRVLKPGGHLLAFGGSRTWHRLAVAIEDAGFEIRDSISWLYGSGFPKSLDVSKAIDKAAGAKREVIGHTTAGQSSLRRVSRVELGYRPNLTTVDNDAIPVTAPATDAARQWQGWGTALKPAHEPIVVARRPLAGTVAKNVLQHGTGGLNIDGCRVGSEVRVNPPAGNKPGGSSYNMSVVGMPADAAPRTAAGRWPANVLLDESAAAELDQQSGISTKPSKGVRGRGSDIYANGKGFANTLREVGQEVGYGDAGGASRFFPVFKYQAKAPARERPRVDGVSHPTVKPLALMRWLVRLVTPPGGVVLDPFLGSGTTAEAARLEGFRCIGVERDESYLPLIRARLDVSERAG